MKVIEHSAQKLRLRLGSTGLSIGICTLDRESDLAAITRLALIVPYHHKQIALSEVTGVTVKRKGRRKTYYPMLELRFGRDFSIGGYAKEDAVQAARAIRDFLKMPR
ncbi:MAG: hypothetical protein KGJ53_09460 [Alphaproteobacteria bacterium]|nr:hypothetical protein [Alphaproteobacteria bacterium]